MTHDLAEKLHVMAERIVAKSNIEGPHFSEHVTLSEDYPRDLVTGLAEGWLRGRRFGCWLPIAGAVYRETQENKDLRNMMHARIKDTWRASAVSALVPMTTLAGPKGKLPA